MASGDMKAVIELASQIKKAQAAEAKANEDANKGLIMELSEKVKSELFKVVGKYQEQIVTLVGEDKAIVKFSYDFSDSINPPLCAISKGSGSGAKRQGGGGTPQRYEKSTTDMLAQYGDMPYKKNGEPTGQTLSQAWNDSTDKNHRFGVRQQLVKLDQQTE